jgi:putative redox protein
MTMGSTRAVRLEWTGSELEFSGVGVTPESPRISIDGDHVSGAAPMQLLLHAAGACSGIDVVLILRKMRVELERLTVDVSGERRAEDPRRFESIQLSFHVWGKGVDQAKAARAVQLSVEKYCSVLHSLAPDISVSHRVAVG